MVLLPWTALFSFILFLVFIFLNKGILRDFFREIDNKTYLFLGLLLLFALILRLLVPPLQHIMYIDEPWYMEAAKNISQSFNQGNYPKFIGWPFILAISFFLCGVSSWVAIYTTIIFGSLTVLSAFFLTYILSKSKIVSFFSAAILAIMPVHIRWSATAETNIFSVFFVTLFLCFSFLYYREKKYSLFWLAIFSLLFTLLIRPENFILIILFLIGCLFFKIKVSLKQIFFVLIIFSIFLTPTVIQAIDLYQQIPSYWLMQAGQVNPEVSNWSLSNLVYNSLNFSSDFLKFKHIPFFIPFLAIIGFIYMLLKQKREACFLGLWFLFFWIIYFSSWFQVVGGRSRFYLSFYPVILIFAGYGFWFVSNLFYRAIPKRKKYPAFELLLFFLLMLLSLPLAFEARNIHNSINSQLATEIPELAEQIIPQDAVIITNWPSILTATTDLKVVDINFFLFNYQIQTKILQSKKLILFFEGFFCVPFISARDAELCELIKNSFNLTPYREFGKGHLRHTFYEITGRN